MYLAPFGPLATDAAAAPAPHSYWVVGGRLAAGSHPAVRGRDPERIARLEDAGLVVFVDLTDSTTTDATLPDYTDMLATGRRVLHPIPDMEVPPAVEMVDILDAIDAALESGDGVYVHCHAGLGRTGTVVGCWLVRHGVEPGKALEVLGRLRSQDRATAHLASPQTAAQTEMVESWTAGR